MFFEWKIGLSQNFATTSKINTSKGNLLALNTFLSYKVDNFIVSHVYRLCQKLSYFGVKCCILLSFIT